MSRDKTQQTLSGKRCETEAETEIETETETEEEMDNGAEYMYSTLHTGRAEYPPYLQCRAVKLR